MDLLPGDVVLVEVRFHQAPGAKVRPTVVVLDSGDEDFVGAPITTRVRSGEFELSLGGWHAAGLNVPSSARMHKVAVLAKANIRRVLGRLSEDDLTHLRVALCRAFCPRLE
ncbi:MAG: type II toxin-antitoxin system PemK/MazF family toxin [Bryobacteraceae bacterium]|jgi:mRNA-degrading endonuclease toxin of MazEF toxin-antitoxin module